MGSMTAIPIPKRTLTRPPNIQRQLSDSTHQHHVPEGEVDTWWHRKCGLRDLMNPAVLGLACHDEPLSRSKLDRDRVLGLAVPKLESASSTQGQAGNGGAIPKTRLVITVPADAIMAIAVKIQQNRIEPGAR